MSAGLLYREPFGTKFFKVEDICGTEIAQDYLVFDVVELW